MSWSVNIVGTPSKVVVALDEFKAGNDVSQKEFDDAKPHLQALVAQNFAKPDSGYTAPIVTLKASGHGYNKDGEQVQSQLSASVEIFYGILAV